MDDSLAVQGLAVPFNTKHRSASLGTNGAPPLLRAATAELAMLPFYGRLATRGNQRLSRWNGLFSCIFSAACAACPMREDFIDSSACAG